MRVTEDLQHPEIVQAAFMCDNCDALSNDIGTFKLEACSQNLAHLGGNPVPPRAVVPAEAVPTKAVPDEPQQPMQKLRRTQPEAAAVDKSSGATAGPMEFDLDVLQGLGASMVP